MTTIKTSDDAGVEPKILQALREQGIKIRLDHIEAMAAAYYKKTNIDPSRVELVEQVRVKPDGGYEIVWFYRLKRSFRPKHKNKG